MSEWTLTPIIWRKGDDPEVPWVAEIQGHQLGLRLGDYPDEVLYTLVVDGEPTTSFDNWPPSWMRWDESLPKL